MTQLPQATHTEAAVLGLMLIEPTIIGSVIAALQSEDFYSERHRRIFDTIVSLYRLGRAIDLVTVKESMLASGELDRIGGPAALAALVDGVPVAQNVEEYIRTIKEKAVLRKLAHLGRQLVSQALRTPSLSADEIISSVQGELIRITQGSQGERFAHLAPLADQLIAEIEEMAGRPRLVTGVATGFYDLDCMTSGLQKSDLIIIAGRPSMGKTAFALSVALNVARSGGSVAIASLEMSKEQITQRILCALTKIGIHQLRRGMLNKKEWEALADATALLRRWRLLVDDSTPLTTLQLTARAQEVALRYGLDVLVVDYLQLLRTPGRFETRQQEVSAISRELKEIAKKLNIPVVCVSQLSRAPEARADRRPQLADLRDSGSIEQDADVVIFLYRAAPEDDSRAQLIIAKQRQGPTGVIEVAFLKECARFDNLAAGRPIT